LNDRQLIVFVIQQQKDSGAVQAEILTADNCVLGPETGTPLKAAASGLLGSCKLACELICVQLRETVTTSYFIFYHNGC
jgi:hypothetical protein